MACASGWFLGGGVVYRDGDEVGVVIELLRNVFV